MRFHWMTQRTLTQETIWVISADFFALVKAIMFNVAIILCTAHVLYDFFGSTVWDAWTEFPGKTFASNMGSASWVTIFNV